MSVIATERPWRRRRRSYQESCAPPLPLPLPSQTTTTAPASRRAVWRRVLSSAVCGQSIPRAVRLAVLSSVRRQHRGGVHVKQAAGLEGTTDDDDAPQQQQQRGGGGARGKYRRGPVRPQGAPLQVPRDRRLRRRQDSCGATLHGRPLLLQLQDHHRRRLLDADAAVGRLHQDQPAVVGHRRARALRVHDQSLLQIRSWRGDSIRSLSDGNFPVGPQVAQGPAGKAEPRRRRARPGGAPGQQVRHPRLQRAARAGDALLQGAGHPGLVPHLGQDRRQHWAMQFLVERALQTRHQEITREIDAIQLNDEYREENAEKVDICC